MLVFDTGLCGSLIDKIDVVWGRILRAYDQLGTPASERCTYALCAAIFDKGRTATPTQYPVIHSKAAVARHCIPAIKIAVQSMAEWAPAGGYEDAPKFAWAFEMLSNLTKFYDSIMFHGQWLSDAAAQEAHDCLQAAGVYHQALCTAFLAEARQLFYLTEKAHYAQHIAIDCLHYT